MVERERRHLRRAELLAAALLALGVVSLALGLGAILLGGARWLALPRGVPLAIWLALAGALGALAALTRRRLLREGSRVQVARAIETEQGMRRGLLVGAIELEGQGALAARAAGAARDSLPANSPLAPALRRASSRRAIAGAGAATAGMLVLLTATPLFADGLRAVMRPLDAWRGALLERPRIEGAPRELLRGTPLRVSVHAPGRRQVVLSIRQTGESWRDDTLVVDPRTGAARWTLDALRGDVRLVATDGRAISDSVVVHAADRPFLGAVTLRASYPRYLGRPAELLPVGEPLRLPRGTVLLIGGRASVPLAQVALEGATERHELSASGHTFAGRLEALHSVRLTWRATGASGAVPDLPPPLEIDVLADSAPHVDILSPTGDTVLVANDDATLALGASDDHGIAVVRLRIVRSAASRLQPVAGAVGVMWSGTATIGIAGLGLPQGDVVRVRAEAIDASPWAQVGVSRELVVRRATQNEIRASARALGDSAVRAARAAVSAQQSLAQRTDEAARAQAREGGAKSGPSNPASSATASATPSAQPKGSMSFQSAEKARALAQEQRAMADRVQRLREATQQLQQQLKAAGALDSSLARQLAEAQALLRQALTPAMMAQMQKLEHASQQLNSEESRDALRDMAQMQQRLKEQLERSAEMLERAAHEGAMQTLGDQARELAAKEKALADSAGRGGAERRDADARVASQLAAQSEQLREEMATLQDRLAKSRADAGAARTGEAEQHVANSETAMRQAAAEMQGKGGTDSGQRARDAAREMARAAQSMQDARASQVKAWKQELTSELDRAVQEMLQLAQQERALEQKARGGASNDDRRGAQSAIEQGVDKANERLQGAGRKSALLSPRTRRAVGDAQQKVAEATRSVSQPQSSASQQAGSLGDAADALTRAAASLARDRERANTASSASGFSEMMQQMQEAAQKQGQINSQAQSLFSMPNGSGAAQSLARALARQQRGVADQLEDTGDAAGGGGDRAAQLAQEARTLADALDGGRLDAGTLARQQQLFRRLLDAGRSLEKEEREDSGKREATSATGDESFTPSGKMNAKAAVRFRPPTWEELRTLSADERRAILDYFTRLNRAPAP